ncbi:MAG: hypothetical protein IPI11_02810 [Haliscomenobacter sp.]|nr:hypothetical protein [Haliscomenobacter sp.]
MTDPTSKRALPLEGLARRLEGAGFHLTPADRVRFMEILGGEPARALLHTPSKLKFLLAPLVAKSAAEQDKFYQVFDHYFEEISSPPEFIPLKKPKPHFGIEDLWWIIPILLIGAGMFYLFRPKPPPAKEPVLSIAGPSYAEPGDTLTFTARIENADSTQALLSWELKDALDSTREAEAGNFRTWTVIADTRGRNSIKMVQAGMTVPGKDTVYKATTIFGIFCPDPPQFGSWAPPATLEVGETFRFSPPAVFRDKEYRFEWNFGDDSVSTLRQPEHAYALDGVYYLSLRVTREDGGSICSTESVHRISVGEEEILLNEVPPQYDWVSPRATWSWGAWLLVGILVITIFYYFIRWLKKPPPPDVEKLQEERIPSADKGPYFIPFRDQNRNLAPDPVKYRLADMLRLRQEGLRKEVDVPASVRETIEGGGFPTLRFRTNTQPTDYLILLDEQSANSHQAKLFKHLTSVLRDQDVHSEVFYYQSDPFRLWNGSYRNGINLDLVLRLYPEYRLIVMGDGHELLDPYASGKPVLRKSTATILKGWKHRLLLTPLAPASWTFREGVLAELFVVFPSDSEGLAGASRFVENGLEASDLPPSFKEWQEQQISLRNDPNLTYCEWRTLADHETYLNDDPELLRWLMALAVYPIPTWEITIAIATGLGIEATSERLLKLARIPWLQQGDLHPRLRKQFLAQLSPQDEALARNAVKQELETVDASVRGGFARFEQQTNLAVQNFALSPFDPDAQRIIREYLDAGALSRTHIEELEINLPGTKEQLFKQNFSNVSQSYIETPPPPKLSLEEFLQNQMAQPEETRQPEKRKLALDRNFWRMVLALLALGALYLAMWKLDSTVWLYKTVFGETPTPFLNKPSRPLRDYYLVKESIFIDSAVQYNNLAVETFFTQTQPELDTLVMGRPVASGLTGIAPVRNYLDLAMASDPTYTLALDNMGRLGYSAGVAYFNAKRKNPRTFPGETNDNQALGYFRNAIAYPSIQRDAQHAAGLCHYYLGNRDSATVYLQTLDQYGYFDTLKLFPNLKTLLGIQETALLNFRLRNPDNRSVEATLDYYVNPRGIPSLQWSIRASGANGLIPGVPVATAKAGFRRTATKLLLKAPANLPEFRSTSLRLELRDLKADTALIDTLLYWPKNWNVRKVPDETFVKAVSTQELRKEMMPSSYRITGQVLNDETGQPLDGVKITLESDPVKQTAGHFRQEATTNARGYFEFQWKQLPEANLQVSAFRPYFSPYSEPLPVFDPKQGDQLMKPIRLKPEKKDNYEQKNMPRIKNN